MCWPGGRGARVGVKVGGGRWSSFGLILCTRGRAGWTLARLQVNKNIGPNLSLQNTQNLFQFF